MKKKTNIVTGYVPKIKITNRNPSRPLSGGACLLELDGRPMKWATSVKVECKARGLAKVTIETYADVEFDSKIADPKIKVLNKR
jgi:hypothetical protein